MAMENHLYGHSKSWKSQGISFPRYCGNPDIFGLKMIIFHVCQTFSFLCLFFLGSIRLLEKDVESLSPSAAAAARLLKSGMTLTQLYSEYVTAQEDLLLEKEENKRLNSYLENIIQVNLSDE